MQGRFKRGGGAAGDPEEREPAAASQQAGPKAVPGAPGARGTAADTAPDGDGGEQSRRARTRARLDRANARRKATGLRRFALRNWRIRTRLIALLTLPVIAALVLGGLRIQTSLQNARDLDQMAGLATLASKATAAADAIQTERDISAGPFIQGHRSDDDVLQARKESDTLYRSYMASASEFEQLDLPGANALLTQIQSDANTLATLRDTAYKQPDNLQSTITGYDAVIKSLIAISQDMALSSSNPQLIESTRALEQFSLAKEDVSMQRALISAGFAHPKPHLSSSDETFGASLSSNVTSSINTFTAIYGTSKARAQLAPLQFNAEIKIADRISDQVLQTGGIGQVANMSYLQWYNTSSAKISAMHKIETVLLEEMQGQAANLRSQAQTDAIVNGVLIALVLLVAVAGAALVARSMVRSLTRLQESAEDVAERRLPELVKTLSEADPQDVDVTVERVGLDSTDEIGHVAHAFDMVHSEAVRLAAEQALLRGNINAMFTNLSRRSQGLIQRQLSLISELESREADPDQLASLFKLDHLATRMRRNGENLLVLAGEDPGRRWTRPVPLVDVLRAAASEVEQYERIELASVPSADVAGRVVNDLVHLLAELLENATSFSSPQTRVRVTGHALPDGRVLVEIHDTGIGLSPDDLADINERLANPPVVDVSVSRRMGLFVVGRLSLRHGIRIQLRPSDSGGTTALVMLPVDVTNASDRRGGGRGGAGAPGGPQRSTGPTPRQRAVPGADAPAAALGQGGRPQIGAGRGQGGPGQAPSGLPTRGGAQAPLPPAGPGRGPRPGSDSGRRPQGPGQRPQQPAPSAELPTGESVWNSERTQHNTPGPDPRGPQGPQHGGRGPQRSRQDAERRPGGFAPQPTGSFQATGSFQGAPADAMDSTVQFARPHYEAEIDPHDPLGMGPVPPAPQPPAPQPPAPVHSQQGYPQQAPQAERPAVQASQPMALPPAAEADPLTRPMSAEAVQQSAGDGGSPIFEAMESNWFRTGAAGRMRAVHVNQERPAAPQPSQPQYQEPGQGAQRPAAAPRQRAADTPRPAAGRAPQRPLAEEAADAPWRTSANDERWRRAEQVREPASDGITPSGLPRRVPRANLVAGTAEQAPLGGPQVSRAPEEVRGRLTNLRRGIQQGRRAGSDGQQGRSGGYPNTGSGPFGNGAFGPDHQER
ncbi:nitrate- and nitrite sensing domain-containing protein [Streptacidiphilus griseoplanus]|uniref:nitrate- and nitrite sensing domain-containing protein n=1 Tax=Peterkaempfera griseoplana TaxID=66896 RepID=UPI0007C6F089|nr:nitrate- and nitrite sensing domain-containing protein [Peterkaempfera griseoplana]